MSVERGNPYGNFNYQVNLNLGDGVTTPRAGFQEISGLNVEVTKTEYRSGNELKNHVRKFSSLYKVGDITFKRGMMAGLDLYAWIDQVRTGGPNAKKQVIIQLLDEAGQTPVMTWTLTNAWPMKYTGPALNAKTGTDVAIEELVVTCEDVTME